YARYVGGRSCASCARGTCTSLCGGGTPTHAEYKTLQDFLFRAIAHEAGHLGMAVHIHAIEGAGGYYVAAGSDPLLLESVFDDRIDRDRAKEIATLVLRTNAAKLYNLPLK